MPDYVNVLLQLLSKEFSDSRIYERIPLSPPSSPEELEIRFSKLEEGSPSSIFLTRFMPIFSAKAIDAVLPVLMVARILQSAKWN